jgi:hypothetical protein
MTVSRPGRRVGAAVRRARRPPTAVHVAVSDCERIRPGLIGQPSNTFSSLAFVLAAVPIARRARDQHSMAWAGVAASAAIEGVGSVAYHGPGGRLAKLVHDAGLVALTATMATARLHERPLRVRPRAAVLAVAAFVLHSLSRTGGPLCSCNSRLQGHAVFHVIAAAALVAAAAPRRGS